MTPAVANPNSVAGHPIDWADELVDGCVADAGATPEIDGTECTGIYTQDPSTVDLADRYCAMDVAWVLDPDPVPSEAVFFLTTGLHPESDLGTTSGGEARPNANPYP